MMRIPISQEAVDLALNKTLNHYDKAPDFLNSAYIINVQDERDLAAFLWARLDEEYAKGVKHELTTRP
ncbi:hypothetical protein [Bifidobacterium ruminantium]|uniref:hypothetical protein n=1 Tax=Bifidobacterium ruminantium TaxID=78346 RepID=UPI001C2160BA|nr:hypothetical protein [Bifidobacterium ruminantium]MBU9111845.1 hypothetical protein [Bifidobacterium ruminantium]